MLVIIGSMGGAALEHEANGMWERGLEATRLEVRPGRHIRFHRIRKRCASFWCAMLCMDMDPFGQVFKA